VNSFFEKIPPMTKRTLHLMTMVAILATVPVAAGETELERLRALVVEQERQIRMLEEQNSRLRGEEMQPRTGGASLTSGVTEVISTPASPPRSSAGVNATAAREYTVEAGDSLARIGRRFDVTIESLMKANGMKDGSIIHPGQKLKIPGNTGGSPVVAGTSAAAAPSGPVVTHTVVAGETFYGISRQYGVSVDRLMAANPDVRPSALRVGQKLRVSQQAAGNEPVANAPANRTSAGQPAGRPQDSPDPNTGETAGAERKRQSIRTVMIDGEMSYGAFAAKHGTTADRLNQLNGLDLDSRTILAKGSELYVPAQP
jgi:LysM repeat protein